MIDIHLADDADALAYQLELMDPFQLYWTTSHCGTHEVQAENALYHVRLHNVISAL